MDSANYPLYIHCNQGRHRTGCVVACLRKIQRWPIEDILTEYKTYADPKARPGDIRLIRAFDPDAVFDYAKSHGYLDDRPFMKRMDSGIANIDALAEALLGNSDDVDFSGVSNASTFSDDGIEMRLSGAEELKHDGFEGERTLSEGANTTLEGATATVDSSESHAQAIETGHEMAVDLDINIDEPTTTVVELSEDVLTPPAEPTMKMLSL